MAEVETLSPAGICVHELKQADEFYSGVLGAEFHGAVTFVTEDTLRGRSVHRSYMLGDYLFAIVLTPDFMPMPADDQLSGCDRRSPCLRGPA